mmetsp:Transcript_17088/g.64704  ORF Transcript_17088/g.64704 Transcript_17088/m.64704 type:complete len:219 (-) Transcript_17088:289-945(-)
MAGGSIHHAIPSAGNASLLRGASCTSPAGSKARPPVRSAPTGPGARRSGSASTPARSPPWSPLAGASIPPFESSPAFAASAASPSGSGESPPRSLSPLATSSASFPSEPSSAMPPRPDGVAPLAARAPAPDSVGDPGKLCSDLTFSTGTASKSRSSAANTPTLPTLHPITPGGGRIHLGMEPARDSYSVVLPRPRWPERVAPLRSGPTSLPAAAPPAR